jgi:hypothetical protein
MLSSIIEQIRGRDAALADALAYLVEDFAYDEILALIQESERQKEGESGKPLDKTDE